MGCTSSSAAPASAPAQAGAPAGSVPTPTGMFAVTVPAGALPGSVVAVPTPTGQLLQVTIPAGAGAISLTTRQCAVCKAAGRERVIRFL